MICCKLFNWNIKIFYYHNKHFTFKWTNINPLPFHTLRIGFGTKSYLNAAVAFNYYLWRIADSWENAINSHALPFLLLFNFNHLYHKSNQYFSFQSIYITIFFTCFLALIQFFYITIYLSRGLRKIDRFSHISFNFERLIALMNLINILTITHPENGKTVFFRFANSSWQAFGNWHVILKYLTPELITLHYFMTYTHNGSKDWQLINIFNNKVCHQIYTGLGVKNYRLSVFSF